MCKMRRRRLNPKIATLFEGVAMIAGLLAMVWLIAAM